MADQELNVSRHCGQAVIRAGTGTPILLLHCGAGSNKSFLPVIDDLSRDFRVVAPDLLGYGANPPWERGARYGLDMELDLIWPHLAEAHEPVHLAGHSYGGVVAIRAATRFSDRIASLTLIEPVVFQLLRDGGNQQSWNEIAGLARNHIRLVAEGRDGDAAKAFMTYWIGAESWNALPKNARASIIRGMPMLAMQWVSMFESADERSEIRRISMPVLLLKGGLTQRAASDVVECLELLLPNARSLEIASAGHMSPQTHPAGVCAAIRAHVDYAAKLNDGGCASQTEAHPFDYGRLA
jgi:pimeloyl-ACP methyl ester carboxylesterase